MSSLSLGDLAQTFMLQRRGAALKAEMGRLNAELTSGQVSDVKAVLAGNVSYLADIENDLSTLGGFKVATSEAAQFTDATQIALERIQDTASNLSATMLTASQNAVGAVLNQISYDAQNDLGSILSALNTSSGGRTLFAGTATDGVAMVDADTLLTALRAATAGAQTPDELVTATDAWFNDPAGFAATAYLGADDTLSAFRLSDTDTVSLAITAGDAEFRDLVRNVAIAAIATDTAFGFQGSEIQDVFAQASTGLFQNQAGLSAVRANVGSAQARIETVATRNATQQTALAYAKGALLQADPYETATKLEEVQFQLQSLYTITARMSDLSLVNFIR
jgi:flagellar hook-associated protein 3 FlgL